MIENNLFNLRVCQRGINSQPQDCLLATLMIQGSLLLWSLEGLSDCKVKGEREGQSDLFSLIFPQIPAKNGKWGQNPVISHYYEGDFILMKVANGQNILTLFWTLRQLFLSSTVVPVVELNGGRYQSFQPSLNSWPQATELNSGAEALKFTLVL